MPTLEFRLANATLRCSVEGGREEWIVTPDASLQRTYDSFDVFIGSKQYDGFELRCSVAIKQPTPGNAAWAQKLADVAHKAAAGKLAFEAANAPVGTIALSGWTEDSPPHVEIVVLLSSDALFRVHQNLSTHVCRMLLTTDPFEAGLAFGDDPDGNDLRWHVDRVEVAVVKSMSLHFSQQ